MARESDANVSARPKMKRVAGNSVFLFIRFLALAVINLYSVRLMIVALGQDDYGLYNTLAGVVTVCVVIVTLFALPLQRFFSYSLGRGDYIKLREMFSASINMLAVMSIVSLLLFETLGVYFVSHVLTIPDGRMEVSIIAFSVSVVSFMFTVMQIPFLAMIMANDDMGLFALVSCVDSLLKLLCAYLIKYSPFDRLFFYVTGILVVSIVTFSLYFIFCFTKYPKCRYYRVKNNDVYLQIVKFIGWTSLGSISGIGLIQGSIILLNIYFGPIVNAAFGVANNVYNSLMSLGNNVIVAFRPSMIKSYANNDYQSLDKLFTTGNKFLVLLLISIAVPLVAEMEYILALWLGQYDMDTVVFSRMFIVVGVIILMGAPISTIVQASGRLKIYYLSSELVMFLHLPLSWFFFRIGMPGYYIYISMIGVGVISHVIRVSLLKNYYPAFSIKWYCLELIVPSAFVVISGIGGSCVLQAIIHIPLLRFIVVCSVVPILTMLMSVAIVLNKSERRFITDMIKKMPIFKNCHSQICKK